MGATSSYSGEIKSAIYGFDTARFQKSLAAELLMGNEGLRAETIVRNDNSSVVENAHSAKSVTGDRRLNSLLESNRGSWI